MTDFELLREYASSNSEEAFATLVRRYANLVHSAALRQIRNPHLAEEITQAVFIVLARRAAQFPAKTVLSGWLLRTARFVALNARRRESYRLHTEREIMDQYCAETDSVWKDIAPELDEAVAQLAEKDRNAIALRFFEQKSFREIAQLLNTSEDSAQKRVTRAVARLRADFVKRGLILPSTLVVAAISARAVEAAPAHLAGSITSAVASGMGVTGNVSALARSAQRALEAIRRRTLMLRSAAVVLIVLMVWLAMLQFRTPTRTASFAAGLGPASLQDNEIFVAAPREAAPTNIGTMILRVVDSETAEPIANARLSVVWDTGYPNSDTNFLTTDLLGECLVSFDRTPTAEWSFRVDIFSDGYVPKFVSWSAWRGDGIEDIPAQYEARLQRGQNIGGVVVSEQREPISEASVVFGAQGHPSEPGAPREREGLAIVHTEFTDGSGRWHCNHAPPQLDQATFRLFHRDHPAASFGVAKMNAGTSGGINRLAEGELRKEAAVLVLKPGKVVAGAVVDELENPIADAKVTQNQLWHDPFACQRTGTDGRFRFGNAAEESLVITVEATGFVATDTIVHPAIQKEQLRFVMSRAATLRGQVVDERGNPIARASVLASGGDFRRGRFDWSTFTDEHGRFEWLSAPPSQRLYGISAVSHESLSGLELIPDGTEHVITLRRGFGSHPVRISGTAVDARSGQPVDEFHVLMGKTVQAKAAYGATPSATLGPILQTTGKAGKFAFLTLTNPPAVRYTIEVRADGYLPANEILASPLSNGSQVQFRLMPAGIVKGTVKTPQNKPAIGAVAMLCSATAGAHMQLPGQLDLIQSRAARTQTDSEGRFALQSDLGLKSIVITHETGYAEISVEQLAASQTVLLQSWCRVEGVLRIGNRPGNNETIYLSNQLWSDSPPAPLGLHRTAVTDAEGRFVIEGVPPGEWQIAHRLQTSNGPIVPLSQCMLVELKSGSTTQVTLGGSGWKVIGRLKADSGEETIDWRSNPQFLTLKSSLTRSAPRQYALVLDQTGAFTIDDVLPGTYELKVRVSDHRGRGNFMVGRLIVVLQKEITLPPKLPEGDPACFDVGALGVNLPRLNAD